MEKDPRYLAMEASLSKYETELRQLKNEIIELKEEKARRIYYQSIVYNICNQLDNYLGYSFSNDYIVCGTIEDPSTEVQDTLKAILDATN